MRRKIVLTLLFGFCWFYLSGCAQMFTAKTKASYILTKPDGSRTEILYESDKNQNGLDAKFGDVHVKVDRAETPVEAITAAALTTGKLVDLLGAMIQTGSRAAPVFATRP